MMRPQYIRPGQGWSQDRIAHEKMLLRTALLSKDGDIDPLTVSTRLKIKIGAAQGLIAEATDRGILVALRSPRNRW